MTERPAGGGPAGGGTPDLRAQLRRAVDSLHSTGAGHGGNGATSDLSIDESLLLHSVGWEPVDLVTGVSVTAVPWGVWNWGQGEIVAASNAHNQAVQAAAERMGNECAKAGGHGVVGVQVRIEVHQHHVDASLVGTAVRPVGQTTPGGRGAAPFISDLGARDFSLLHNAGWQPVGLAFGASFVYAPRRSVGTAVSQRGQNVELTNATEAIYSARALAMDRVQRSALSLRGTGIVAVTIGEGPMSFAHHAIGFTAWGTAVRLAGEAHRYLQPDLVLPLDDVAVQFAAQSMRGKAPS